MRRWIVLAFLLAVTCVLAGSRLARAQSGGVEICHVSTPGSGAGKIISLKEGSPALNAHKMLHGDSEDFTVVNEEARTCTCDPAADPRPTGGDDDSEGDDDSGESGDDDSGDDDSDDDGGQPEHPEHPDTPTPDDHPGNDGDDDSGEPGDDESDGDDD